MIMLQSYHRRWSTETFAHMIALAKSSESGPSGTFTLPVYRLFRGEADQVWPRCSSDISRCLDSNLYGNDADNFALYVWMQHFPNN